VALDAVQYCRGHHLHDSLAVHTVLPAASFEAATQVSQHVATFGWHTPMEVEAGHHLHLVVVLQSAGPSADDAGQVE
jgi:hypothetical protein